MSLSNMNSPKLISKADCMGQLGSAAKSKLPGSNCCCAFAKTGSAAARPVLAGRGTARSGQYMGA